MSSPPQPTCPGTPIEPNSVSLVDPRAESTSEPRLLTFGCRLNIAESAAIRRHATAGGLGNAIIVNTCAVTAEAVRQAMQAIRRARRENPAARIVVTGCAAQIAPGKFAAMPEVDHVLGNNEKLLPETWAGLAAGTSACVHVGDIMSPAGGAGQLAAGYGTRSRAFLQVQNGCDHRCTFCVIPFGRGPSRSVPADAVVAEVQRLVAEGFAEVVLTGVDVTSYGADLAGEMRLGRLVRRVLRQVPDLPRLRLSSIDQVEADDDLLTALAEQPRLMPHLHLSLQSGSDLILKRMKRRHLRDDAIGFCAKVRRLRPDVAFGADLIAGFPTETEAMFEQSLELVDACGLAYLHVFPFSPRPGTPAARMPQVPGTAVKERSARLRSKGKEALHSHLSGRLGRELNVLMERNGTGHAADFSEIEISGVPAGQVVRARAVCLRDNRLVGEVVT